MSEYRVDLDTYNGPLDLLLYLIRREEVDIYDIPIARIAAQYVHYVELLKSLDPNSAGDFVVMLATLIELKSRAMLPRAEAVDDEEDDLTDPRLELVRQLLAYKGVKDAAHDLALSAQIQSLKFPRTAGAGVGLAGDSEGDLELEDVSIWALMNAFTNLLEQTGKAKPYQEMVFDDTPLALHAADITDSLERAGGSQLFESIFTDRSKAEMIGLFLALLELVRRSRIRLTQDQAFGPITLHLIDRTSIDADNSDTLNGDAAES